MSDDLIKRLGKSVWTLDQAEDRIKELERENARLDAGWTDANARALAARLEVIKAVEIGTEMAKSIAGNYYLPNAATRWFYMMVELADEPLGAEFVAVWDANKDELYEA
jgi:tRNA threonylcarbamoyladenosine modification (KEOPS) complex Cgi121 subunit